MPRGVLIVSHSHVDLVWITRSHNSQRKTSKMKKVMAVNARRLRNRRIYLAFDLTTVVGFLATIVLLLRLIHGSFGTAFAFSALAGAAGGVLGMVIAVVITPFTLEEGKRWTHLGSAFAGAVAGYGIGILDDSIAYIFKDARLLTDQMLGLRVGVFVSCALFALVYGFTYRRYYVTLDLEFEELSQTSTTAS